MHVCFARCTTQGRITVLADLRAGRCSNTAQIVYESMMKLSVEKLHITSLQKAYGALEDSTTVGLVGLAKANSEFKIYCRGHMYYNHRQMVFTTSMHCQRDYPKLALGTLREGDPTFIEELLNYSQRRHIFKILKLKLRRRYKSSGGRAFGKSLRCSFQGDNNLGYDIPGAFMLITLLYGSCAGDDNNHEYDIPGAGPSQLPPLGWLLLEIQKDQQPLTMSSMLNLCMVHYQKATQCLASKLRNGQDQS
ncbi:hypothetical protein YC2023_077013 [Brassica napus]